MALTYLVVGEGCREGLPLGLGEGQQLSPGLREQIVYTSEATMLKHMYVCMYA